MNRALAALLALASTAPVTAQSISGGTIDPSQVASKTDVAAAKAAADSALATAQTAQAAIPPRCAAAPSADTATGAVGVAATCIRPADAAPKTNVMPATATTIADGSFTGSWPATFTAAPTTACAAVKSTSEPYICQVGSFTASTFSGKCWRLVQMTLPGVATGLLNLVLVPFGAPPTGSTVMVVGRQ